MRLAVLGGALLAGVLVAACGGDEAAAPTPAPAPEPTPAPVAVPDAVIHELMAAEEWLANMRGELPTLAGRLVAGGFLELEEGAAPAVRATRELPGRTVYEELDGGLADALAEMASVGDVKLSLKNARNHERQVWDSDIVFKAWGADADGRPVALKGALEARWDGAWVTSVTTTKLRRLRAPAPLFEELRDAGGALDAARRSLHEEKILAMYQHRDTFVMPPHFELPAFDRHPGIAVVDIDDDGWDDVYVMARWGANQLLRNRGDGTFEEVAAAYGLDLVDHCSAAVFADFDNDGDSDVVIGRTHLPSVYLENRGAEGGGFVQADPGVPLPSLVSAVSAADVDGDGVLDVYFGTYAVSLIQETALAGPGTAIEDLSTVGLGPMLPNHLPPDQAAELGRRLSAPDHQFFVDMAGPPNVLLRGLGGGRFAPFEGAAPTWRSTYGQAFADYDDDGDPDLYLANDFAPNSLLRNDGDGRFTDVTADAVTQDHGFGMGVGWGDFDADGRLDLYVSNMYSKAGLRITARLEGLDERMGKAARGNTLLRNTGDERGFELISGEGEGDQPVRIAGWSWGGQFGDLDNDGRLDLYVPAGYYTAPKQVASVADC